MKKIIRFVIVLVIILFVILGAANVVLYSGLFGLLSPFSIKSVDRIENTNYRVSFNKVRAAKYYELEITDSSNVVVYKDKVTKNELEIDFGSIIENTIYTLNVTAYNKKGDKRSANNTLSFKYSKEPTFSDDNVVMLEESGTLVYINGDLSSKKYSLIINKATYDTEGNETSNKEIYNKILTDGIFDIKGDKYNTEIVKLSLSIIRDKRVIDTLDMFYNMNPLKDVVINKPANESTIDYSDVFLSIENDSSAEKYELTIYNDKGTAISTATIYDNEVLLDRSLFTAGGTYSIGVTSVSGNYNKTNTTKFTMDGHKLEPVAINKDVNSIRVGDTIELSQSDNAGIIYTVDGTSPLSGGIGYEGPITIKKDTVIKAYAKNGYEISTVSTFDIKVAESINTDITVYLSSSNQVYNIGEKPFTNERYEMDLIAGLVEKKLKDNNIKVIRNDYLTDAATWNKEAVDNKANLKVALQTEASIDHEKYGLTTWINNRNASGYSIAKLLHKNIVNIYDKDIEAYDHGVKYTQGIKNEESSDISVPNIVLTLGYHDNIHDAEWLTTNREKIADNIANSILSYYGLE